MERNGDSNRHAMDHAMEQNGYGNPHVMERDGHGNLFCFLVQARPARRARYPGDPRRGHAGTHGRFRTPRSPSR